MTGTSDPAIVMPPIPDLAYLEVLEMPGLENFDMRRGVLKAIWYKPDGPTPNAGKIILELKEIIAIPYSEEQWHELKKLVGKSVRITKIYERLSIEVRGD